MHRRRNYLIWIGFVIVVGALVSYIPFFALFPLTRDVPWANYLLFILGGGLIAAGLRRAVRSPDAYKGKTAGKVLSVLSVLMFVFFLGSVLYFGKQIPSAESALRTGQTAPSFTLLNTAGTQVASADLLKAHRAIVLVFYRGFW